MARWLRIVQTLAMVVIVVGGVVATAQPAVAVSYETCDCYDWYEAIAEQQSACSAAAEPQQVLCAFVYSCYKDEWDHIHFSGICVDYTPDPCPPVMPQGDCQP
jgi:hypothetical protein